MVRLRTVVRRCLRGERQEFSKEVSYLTKRQQGSQFGRKVLQFGRVRILISEHSREAVLARSHARTPPQAADAHADVTVYRSKSGLGVALRAERLSASRTRVTVSYTHLRAHETGRNLVCRLLLEK